MDAVFLGDSRPARVIGTAVVPDHDVALAPDMVVFRIRRVMRSPNWRSVAPSASSMPTSLTILPDRNRAIAAGFGMGADDRVVDRRPVLVLGLSSLPCPTPAIGERPVTPSIRCFSRSGNAS